MRNSLSLRASAILLVGIVIALPVRAKFVKPDLINVPVERLIKNLEALAKDNPRDAEIRLNLARVHAMAYALKTATAEVWNGRENRGAWFGYTPAHVPFEVKTTDDKNMLKTAREHLAKAIERYEETLKLDPSNLTAALGHAWCVEQSGDKKRAITEYRKVIEAAWEKERALKHAGVGWRSVTAEAAGYLIPLLDKRKDKREIATLEARAKKTSGVRRPITPLVIPLRDGLTTSQMEDRSARVNFDADGTGLEKSWTWITNDAGWLVYDPRHTGAIRSALQMFGSVTFWLFWENGYHALAAMDDNRDGKLAGEELRGFAVWQDINRNGTCDQGEVKPVADLGIVAISCQAVRDETHPDKIVYSPRGVFFRDGSSRSTYDLVLHPAISTVE